MKATLNTKIRIIYFHDAIQRMINLNLHILKVITGIIKHLIGLQHVKTQAQNIFF